MTYQAARRQHGSLHCSSARSLLFKWWLALVDGTALRSWQGANLSRAPSRPSCKRALYGLSLTSFGAVIASSHSTLTLWPVRPTHMQPRTVCFARGPWASIPAKACAHLAIWGDASLLRVLSMHAVSRVLDGL